MNNTIINDVVTRTSGELFIGVVGSVRSGKSSFIRKFMELKVLPHIKDENTYKMIMDELPQSAEGKTIQTIEPKFVPSTTVSVEFNSLVKANIKMIDCVGFLIPSAKGYLDESGNKKKVETPWFLEPIPFDEAAELGTRKVIETHSNIGIVVTSDGSFSEFSRREYEDAEEQVIAELKKSNKPFVIVLNTKKPFSEETTQLVLEIEAKYNNSCVAMDFMNMSEADVDNLLMKALEEFDISELNIEVPSWINKLSEEIDFKNSFNNLIAATSGNYRKMKDCYAIKNDLLESGLFKDVELALKDTSTGFVRLTAEVDEDVYHSIISTIIGDDISDRAKFIEIIQNYQKSVKILESLGNNFEKLDELGYQINLPKSLVLNAEKPTLLKQGGRYGIKLNVNSYATLVVKIKIDSVFEPIIGSIEQAQGLIDKMTKDYEEEPSKLWNCEVFGQKLDAVLLDGIKSKINSLNDDVLLKYKESMEKIVNLQKGGVVSFIY